MKYCNNCKKLTEHKQLTFNKNGNNDFICLNCNLKSYTIQGFNINLM
jgi:hypothetical protein